MHTIFPSRSARPTLQRQSLWLLVALLVTLLSPHFGWEMTASDSTRPEHVLSDSGAGVVLADASSTCDQDGDVHHHHCCAGHQLSHSPAQVSDLPAWLALLTSQRIARGDSVGFRSFIPSGPDRPPTQALA